jgi:formylglycine-generating enzyme required for sulfatase activity
MVRNASNSDIAWFKGGKSHVGTETPILKQDGEGPKRSTVLKPFGMSKTAVTNAQFSRFVAQTGYTSEAYRIGWSFVFQGLLETAEHKHPPNLPWWAAIDGAKWDHPLGPNSDLLDLETHPVIHVSYHDAVAYADWAGDYLPNEAEWEHAARGGDDPRRYPWGDTDPTDDAPLCNIWQGQFPKLNTVRDGYYGTCPVDVFEPNAAGLTNMSGNVWEWCRDPFKVRSNTGAGKVRNIQARQDKERLLKGGSFLCHASYCWRYRIAARTGRQPDNAASHVGFRVAYRD